VRSMLERMGKQTVRRPIPFYGSYAAFYRAMKALKEIGVPRRIDSHTLTPKIGADESPRIVSGFQSLGWIDEIGTPSDDLVTLIRAFGEDTWPSAIADVLPKTYSFIPPEWEDLTPPKLREAFSTYIGRDVGAIRTAETFFLCLASEGRFKIPDAVIRRVDRAVSDAKRTILIAGINERAKNETDPVRPAKSNPTEGRRSAQPSWIDQIWNLTALIDEQDMTDREKNAVLILLSYLRKREQREREKNSA
jgi:hypothetical protein